MHVPPPPAGSTQGAPKAMPGSRASVWRTGPPGLGRCLLGRWCAPPPAPCTLGGVRCWFWPGVASWPPGVGGRKLVPASDRGDGRTALTVPLQAPRSTARLLSGRPEAPQRQLMFMLPPGTPIPAFGTVGCVTGSASAGLRACTLPPGTCTPARSCARLPAHVPPTVPPHCSPRRGPRHDQARDLDATRRPWALMSAQGPELGVSPSAGRRN